MPPSSHPYPETRSPAARSPAAKPPAAFGSNEIRLSPRQWLIAAAIVAVVFAALPAAWERIESFEPGPDYRIPYRLGEDYWLYRRYCRRVCPEERTLVVGDSVVWGHYVSSHETLSHYLNELAGGERFANLGLDGIHPAALAGLLEDYARDLSGKRVLLVCNPLWMSSPTHDLQSDKSFSFNHPRLVPQFFPRIPCYKEPLANRLGIVVERHVPLFAWVGHLRNAYFDNSDFAAWLLEHPGENPAAAVTLELPSPDEPPSPPPDARPWTVKGLKPFNPPWVELETSLQWRSFCRGIEILRGRGNRVFVLVGPFNEPMLDPRSLDTYRRRKAEIGAWLARHEVPHYVPAPLASELYADASHPLAEGYAEIAGQLWAEESFAAFCRKD